MARHGQSPSFITFLKTGLFCLFCANLFLWIVVDQHSSQKADKDGKILLILKLPRSGSSLLVDLINRLPNVYISKEIIQQADRKAFSASERMAHVKKAFQAPTDKLKYNNHFFPSGRKVEDYWLHPSIKWLHSLDVLGISLNPETMDDIDWSLLLDEDHIRRKLKIIVLFRKNIIKTAISGLIGEQLKYTCGSSNLRSTDKRSECHPPSTWTLQVDDLFSSLNRWVTRYQSFWRTIHTHFPVHKFDVRFVSYEELQIRPVELLQEIITNFKLEPLSNDQMDAIFSGPWKWEKRSKDDLSKFLSNYREISEKLAENDVCQLLSSMLQEKTPHQTLTGRNYNNSIPFFNQISECAKSFNGRHL